MSKKQDLGLKQRLREADAADRVSIIDGLPYDVGFGKPPKATRFSSERQPARRGRPRGSENFATTLNEELAAKIEVTENGKRRRRSKQRVSIKQLVNKAVSGDLKALALLLDCLRKTQIQVSAHVQERLIDQRDLETFRDLAETFAGSDKGEAPSDEGGQS